MGNPLQHQTIPSETVGLVFQVAYVVPDCCILPEGFKTPAGGREGGGALIHFPLTLGCSLWESALPEMSVCQQLESSLEPALDDILHPCCQDNVSEFGGSVSPCPSSQPAQGYLLIVFTPLQPLRPALLQP